ncbi:MAG: hypothetical protein JXJ22_04710 [Bacteroidales bacterium]|nr:hypothetical protein [Bacteroidales bacterium]
MFKLEKDMLPIIEYSFSQLYEDLKIKREFNSGNGICDLTCAILNNYPPDITINNFNEMFYLLNYINIKGKRISPANMISENNLDKKTLNKLLSKLHKAGYLKEEENYLVIEKTYKPLVKKVISVEAKLKNWKDGFYQALRYKCFSHKSFLAISNEFVRNVDVNLFKEHNIGLISVYSDDIKILYNPKSENPTNKTAYYHLSENFIN